MNTPVGQVISGLTHLFTTSSEPRCLAFLFAALTTNQRDISRICVKGQYQTRLGRGFCCPYTHTPSSGSTRSGNRQEGALCWDGAHWQSLAPPSQIHVCLVGISATTALLTLLYHLAGLPAVVTNQSRLEKVCLWVPFFVWQKFLHERVPFVWQTDRIYGCDKCGSLPCTWHRMPLLQFCFLGGSSLLLSSALHTVWHNSIVVDADQKDLLSMTQTIIRLS